MSPVPWEGFPEPPLEPPRLWRMGLCPLDGEERACYGEACPECAGPFEEDWTDS